MFLIKLLQYEPGLVLLIKAMVVPQHVPLTMHHYDYGWMPPRCHMEHNYYASEQVGSTSMAVEDGDMTGVVFNKKAFAGAKEFTDQQVNLHHRQQLGLATTEAAPLLQFDAVAFLLAETVETLVQNETKEGGASVPLIKLKWDAVVLVGRELERYLVKLFRCALLCANHGGRAGLLPKDLQLARRIIGERG